MVWEIVAVAVASSKVMCGHLGHALGALSRCGPAYACKDTGVPVSSCSACARHHLYVLKHLQPYNGKPHLYFSWAQTVPELRLLCCPANADQGAGLGCVTGTGHSGRLPGASSLVLEGAFACACNGCPAFMALWRLRALLLCCQGRIHTLGLPWGSKHTCKVITVHVNGNAMMLLLALGSCKTCRLSLVFPVGIASKST